MYGYEIVDIKKKKCPMQTNFYSGVLGTALVCVKAYSGIMCMHDHLRYILLCLFREKDKEFF